MHYYNYDKILSYNCPVNILIGERGVGKTYGAKNFIISDYLKRKNEFLYLRRYENELKEVFQKDKSNKLDFFDDIKEKYPDHNLETKNRKFYIDNYAFGIAKRMTAAQDLKSSTHNNIKTILIDEYFIEKNKRYYLPNERYDITFNFW